MKTVLIVSVIGDVHAYAVEWALRRKGHNVITWFLTDYPSKQNISFFINNQEQKITIKDILNNPLNLNVDVVWYRRVCIQQAPDFFPKEDQQIAYTQNIEFIESIIHQLAPSAFWVNPMFSSKACDLKINQLNLAKSCGLNLPETIVSNDYEEIVNFAKKHEEIIFKTIAPMQWEGRDKFYKVYTSSISLSDLEEVEPIKYCPSIYQKKISKAYEIRATFMGKQCLSLKINSQSNSEALTDWRLGVLSDSNMPVEAFELPRNIYQKCIALMQKLSIVYGAFDFIVDKSGEYYFVEVNEMGQFLWVEEMEPNLPMLQVFSEFLVSCSESYEWDHSRDTDSYTEYLSSPSYQFDVGERIQRHADFKYQFITESEN
ncbi:MvdC/MvdD family ATP grasp protein [Thalassotalea montiporae]